MIETLTDPFVIILVALAVLGIGIAFFSVRRRWKIRRQCARALEATLNGRHSDALKYLLEAERCWAFNSHDGGTKSIIRDLDDLSQIINQLESLPGMNGEQKQLSDLKSVVSEHRNLFQNRGNFGIDGRMMKKEAAHQWVELCNRLEDLRRQLRKSCETPK